jgi:hypothetical protein
LQRNQLCTQPGISNFDGGDAMKQAPPAHA